MSPLGHRRATLGTKLALAFALVAAATALISAAFVYLTWQRSFDTYVRARVDRDAQVLADIAASTWQSGWAEHSLQEIGRIAARAGLRVQVLSAGGAVLLDNADLLVAPGLPGSGMMHMMGADGEIRLQSASDKMAEPIVLQPVTVLGERVGSVRVASASPGTFLTARDLQFRTAALAGVSFGAAIAVVLATLGGLLYSRAFARPIQRVTRTAAALRSGHRDARTGISGDDEVGSLARALDEMADAIESERESERRLTADVAHELRTPLQAIQATVEAIQDGVMPADSEHLGVVRDETVRLARLADSILELSRLEKRSVPLRMVELDPSVPLRRALETHRALLESVGLTVVEEIAEGLEVRGDDDRLTQTFGNLLGNAAHYTPEGGTVTVSLAREDGEAVARVSDTGIGVDPEEMRHIFSRFWRGGEARERARKGFGIGLAVVREIVEQHGGTVDAVANGDEGTTFTVRIPLAGRSA